MSMVHSANFVAIGIKWSILHHDLSYKMIITKVQ